MPHRVDKHDEESTVVDNPVTSQAHVSEEGILALALELYSGIQELCLFTEYIDQLQPMARNWYLEWETQRIYATLGVTKASWHLKWATASLGDAVQLWNKLKGPMENINTVLKRFGDVLGFEQGHYMVQAESMRQWREQANGWPWYKAYWYFLRHSGAFVTEEQRCLFQEDMKGLESPTRGLTDTQFEQLLSLTAILLTLQQIGRLVEVYTHAYQEVSGTISGLKTMIKAYLSHDSGFKEDTFTHLSRETLNLVIGAKFRRMELLKVAGEYDGQICPLCNTRCSKEVSSSLFCDHIVGLDCLAFFQDIGGVLACHACAITKEWEENADKITCLTC